MFVQPPDGDVLAGIGEADGEEKPGGGEDPQDKILAAGVVERGTHGIEVEEAVGARRIRDDVGECHPLAGHHLLGPRDARKEEKYQRGGDEQHHTRLAVAHTRTHSDSKEDSSQQVGHHEKQDVRYVAYMRQVEQPREPEQQNSRQGIVDDEIRRRTLADAGGVAAQFVRRA